MKTFLKLLPTFIDRFIWMIGLITIMSYTMDRWPAAGWITMLMLLLGFGAWYGWKFAIQPFRQGLKGK